MSKCKSKKEEVCAAEESIEETNPGNTSAPRDSNCRRFGARNCRDNLRIRFHMRVKYVGNHCREFSQSRIHLRVKAIHS